MGNSKQSTITKEIRTPQNDSFRNSLNIANPSNNPVCLRSSVTDVINSKLTNRIRNVTRQQIYNSDKAEVIIKKLLLLRNFF
jgi:hypothetical protein